MESKSIFNFTCSIFINMIKIYISHLIVLTAKVLWLDASQVLPISFRVTLLALGQSYDCPSASEATLKDMGKYNTWPYFIVISCFNLLSGVALEGPKTGVQTIRGQAQPRRHVWCVPGRWSHRTPTSFIPRQKLLQQKKVGQRGWDDMIDGLLFAPSSAWNI